MLLTRLLVSLVEYSRRHALAVVLGGLVLAAFSAFYATHHLGVTTDTDQMFAPSLPWRKSAVEFKQDFPQFRDLLVAVIDAQEPEEADATAAALSDAISILTRCDDPMPRPSCARRACCSSTRSRSRT
jgi:predicted RND superfamily exporter protein